MSHASLLFAFWPFTAGWMLLWGLAAAIPILIHLWNQRRYQTITWAAMEFLLAALRKDARRVRFEQLLLLLVRVLILLLFAVALADPVLSLLVGLRGVGLREGSTHIVLVLDGSYSMDYRRDGRSCFAAAQEAAVRLVEQSVQGDGFTLVLLADLPQVVIGQPVFDSAVIASEIRNLPLPHGGASLPATLAEVAALLPKIEEQHPRLRQHRVCWFTDLGRTTWDAVAEGDCRTRIARLAERAQLELYDVGQTGAENAALVRLALRESFVTAGRSVTCEAEVQSFSARDHGRLQVEFRVDGQRVAERPFELAAGGRAVATLAQHFDTPGEHSVEAILLDDALPIDNHRWLSVPVRDAIRALCVQGQPDEARYLALALEPTKSDRAQVRPEIVSETALVETDLTRYDAVFLCNVGRFGRDEAAVLHRYLKQGGGLVVFLGDQVQAENYNSELGDVASGRRVLPARLGPQRGEAQYRFAPPNYRHPIVAPFRDQPRAGLLTTPVWRYFQLTLVDVENCQVPLAFENGDPVIVDEALLRGRCLLFATAASTTSVDRAAQPPAPWTALPSWPSFVPLMQETLAYVVGGRNAARNVLVGEPLQATLRSTEGNIALTVAGPAEPDGSFPTGERLRPFTDDEDSRWAFTGTQRSGLYRAQYGPPLDSTQLFAVNVDTRESNLERIDPELLPPQFHQASRHAARPASAASAAGRRPYFRQALAAVLVLLLVETVLAWYFGSRS